MENQFLSFSLDLTQRGVNGLTMKLRNHGMKKGVLGVYVHNLKDSVGNQSTRGKNPFEDLTASGMRMSNIVKAYDPPYFLSTQVYDYIKQNLAYWIEEAIIIRGKYA